MTSPPSDGPPERDPEQPPSPPPPPQPPPYAGQPPPYPQPPAAQPPYPGAPAPYPEAPHPGAPYGQSASYGQAPSYGPPAPPNPSAPWPQGAPYPPAFPFPGSAGAPAPLSSTARLLGWVIAALGALTFVFAFLPWATVGDLSVDGIGGSDVGGAKDGVITLPLGVVCVVAGLSGALARRRGPLQLAMPIVSLVMGILIAVTALVDIGDVSDQPSAGFFVVSVGIGLYLTLFAGLALVAVSVAAIVKRR